MPHIHRIRVNNVKYNFGTQYYDDFIMRFDGKNALYDLANGGGKSVLMLLLFQNLIPNCTLDDKQPVEKLFRTNEGSTSIHSLIEWKLDECDIVDGYKYMLTGFCARKAKDDGDDGGKRDAASIDYFNYVIFYREYNDNDLVNLPLSKGREHMTYTGLRVYLKELEHKDYHLKIHIFDRKGAYQSFIAGYGLYESQWEIIRGINKTEGHVRTYFETNYKTTRKVVEDLLIEEIIQKAYAQKTDGGDEDMAGTLLSIQGRLLELSKKRQEILSYDRQAQMLESFSGRVLSLTKLYGEEDSFKYALVRGYHGLLEALKVKNRDASVYVKEQTLAEKRLFEIERKLDTVKVQKSREQLKNLENHTSKVEEQLNTLEGDYARASLALSEAESMRDFLEYEETAKNAGVVKEALNRSAGDPHGHLLELNRLSKAARKKIGQQAEDLHKKRDDIRLKSGKLESMLDEQSELLRQAQLSEAVADHHIASGSQEEKQLVEEISELRHQVNALLVEGSEKEIRAYRAGEAGLLKRLDEDREKCSVLNDEMQSILLTLEQKRAELANDTHKKKEVADFFDAYQEHRSKAEGLLKVYGAPGYDGLKQSIYSRYKKAAQDLYEVSRRIQLLKDKKVQLQEKNPVLVSESVLSVMDYIRRSYNASCIAGADYLKEVPAEEKKVLLGNMPYLPFAVIVRTEFEKIAGDLTFRTMDFGAGQVVLVRYDAVLSGECLTDGSRIIFTGPDPLLYVDDTAAGLEVQKTEQLIAQCEARKNRLVDQEKTYQTDLDYVYHFMDTYYERRLELLADRDAVEKEMTALKQEIKDLEKQLEADRAEEKRLCQEIEGLKKEADEMAKERSAIESMAVLNGKLDDVRNLLHRYGQQKSQANQQILAMNEAIADTSAKSSMMKKQIEVLEGQLLNLKKMWQTQFAAYYVENDDDGDDESEEQLSDIEVRFSALCQVYENENSDIEDKKKLLETYEKTLERLEYAIELRNMTIGELARKQRDGEFVACDKDSIREIRERMENLSEQIQLQKAAAKDSLANTHKLTGSVENAVNVIEEKYGYYKEVDLKNMDYDVFIREYHTSLAEVKEKQQTLSESIVKNQKEIRALEDIKKDMERLMRSVSVTAAYTKDSDRNDENFYQKFAMLSEMYERLRKDEELKWAEFEKDKDKLVETLRLLKAYDLADEIRYQVSLPKTEDEARTLGDNISDTVKIIMLEKERIEKGIEDMQKIKENFESQCLQRCEDIRMELERLPKMSKITLGDEQIQMIGLKIPYVKQELYGQKMSDYIDRIVEKADEITDEGERLKYLKNKLAWKHLFSVIVTDMDQIRLSLYKREPIREQSRFLKYEEAVGSTGQSQGIYIQFLIAVINYISAIHSRSNDTSGLKKVIFIDNPFGAAKDIYIWEPIFALLKENNVQLIVPARGATPAITGKFDVNYVLGQKVVGTRQQTVVVDYHSSVDVASMEYRTIEYEQQVFDFV